MSPGCCARERPSPRFAPRTAHRSAPISGSTAPALPGCCCPRRGATGCPTPTACSATGR